jgi:hypothetical protein
MSSDDFGTAMKGIKTKIKAAPKNETAFICFEKFNSGKINL